METIPTLLERSILCAELFEFLLYPIKERLCALALTDQGEFHGRTKRSDSQYASVVGDQRRYETEPRKPIVTIDFLDGKPQQIGNSNLGGTSLIPKHCLHSSCDGVIIPIVSGKICCIDEGLIDGLEKPQQKEPGVIALSLFPDTLLDCLGIQDKVLGGVVLVVNRDAGGKIASSGRNDAAAHFLPFALNIAVQRTLLMVMSRVFAN